MNINSIEEYIEKQKLIQTNILNFIENDYNDEENYQNIIHLFDKSDFQDDSNELKSILYLILKIANNHYRGPNFFDKIFRILQYFNSEMKIFFTNFELYQFFKKNKRIILYLIENNIMKVNKPIALKMKEDKDYIDFFWPEIKQFFNNDIFPNIKIEEQENYKEKRRIGENDDYICRLIRQDLIEEFITHVKKQFLQLDVMIDPSIYETNSLLLKTQPTLIEYAAFFGSIQVFKYLYLNKVKLTKSLWIYAVHGDNPELINLLEEKDVFPIDRSYEKCLKESIKCHHNDVANYIISNLLNQDIENTNKEMNFNQNEFAYGFRYYNYFFFPKDFDHRFIFYYLCFNDYYNLVELYLKTKQININEEMISLLYFNTISF